jgi:uroporphyrinogen decarboxylase
MNHYQRVRAVFNGEWPDCQPVMLHNFLSAAAEAGLSMQQYRDSPEAIAKAFIQSVETYDYDGVIVDIDTATLAGAVGVPVDFPENQLTRCLGPAIERLEQTWDLQSPNVLEYRTAQVWLEAVRLLCRYFGDEVWIRGNCDQAPFSLACLMRGMGNWFIDLTEERSRPAVDRLLEYCTEAVTQFVAAMAATGAHMVSNGDSPAGLLSPNLYRTFAQPSEQRIARVAHDWGLPYALHVCGKTNHILRDLATLEADAIELDHRTSTALAHATLGDSKVFIGNIDPSEVLYRGSSDLVRKKTRELLAVFSDTPRLIVNAGCALPPDTPAGNVHAMVRAARESLAEVS